MTEKTLLKEILKTEQLSEEELGIVLSSFKKIEFKKNDYLFKEGQTTSEYYFLEKGFIRSFAIDYEGNDITTGFYSKTEIVIDWSSFFLRTPTRENFQATTDCVCWKLGFDKFQELFHSIKSFREGGRTRLVGSYFALKNKNISMITTSAKDRYLKLLKENPEIIKNASLKHIATYLGITDTSLSRIRKEITLK